MLDTPELTHPGFLKRGDKSSLVRLPQEWLCLHDIRVAIDGDFGPATERALRAFQTGRALEPTGSLDVVTWEILVAPMRKALTPLRDPLPPLGRSLVLVAEQHLASKPREVGGPNMGPWVRYYTRGREGREWRWCAGAVSRWLDQAVDVVRPIRGSLSCDELATQAKVGGRFIDGDSNDAAGVAPGDLFLLRGKTPGDWIHTGLVVGVEPETVTTIEGNSNQPGSVDGDGVYRRVRARTRLDFIRMD